MEEELEIVKLKRVKGIRKKVGRNKGGKVKVNFLNIEVYVDVSFVKIVEVIEFDVFEFEFFVSVVNCYDGVLLLVKSYLGCEFLVRSFFFVYVSFLF